MLATPATTPQPSLHDARLVYEPKYDGIRALVEIGPRDRGADVRLVSRLGNDKSAQFPELVDALVAFGARLQAPVVLDGEIVALDEGGQPTGFQRLQGRMHRHAPSRDEPATQPVALVVFDLIREGDDDLCGRPWTERRTRLERLFAGTRRRRTPVRPGPIRLSEVSRGDGRALLAEATARGWEGLIAKRAASPYRPGRRSPDWLKLKLVREQEFVVGGWTDPRGSRRHFGALLVGYHDRGALRYAGHIGSGFDDAELDRVATQLRRLTRTSCPFDATPATNERPHWVEPELVAQVRFTEWTDEGLLRHPVYLGLREDVTPGSVRREPGDPGASGRLTRLHAGKGPERAAARPRASRNPALPLAVLDRLLDDLAGLEADRGEGVLTLPGDVRLSVTNLRKLFWTEPRITKGELLRYYVTVAPYLLPVVADRPLVMKRLPNGIAGKAFYQQRAPDTVPEGVRVAMVEGDKEVPARFIGGTLATLLHMTQLATISQDPWFSRVGSPHEADHAALDLDPGDGVPFARVLDTARWVRDELEAIGVRGFPKTSGADGLHIYIPLEPGTPYEAGLLFCQIVATIVARKHPAVATIERRVRARGRTVYIDYLQNIEGKTLACAYSARGSDYAGASTPLTWPEVDGGVDRRDFTIRTLPARLEAVGDLWEGLRKATGANLLAVERYLGK
jgi:bifunctional non-homologous end joining protein LigD